MAEHRLKRPPRVREDGVVEVPLTRGCVALIDGADYHHALHNWSVTDPRKGLYAFRNVPKTGGGQTLEYLHRRLLGLSIGDGLFGDHVDGNTLDCRRQNLRVADAATNSRNKIIPAAGRYPVGINARNGRFRAEVSKIYVGTYDTIEEAVEERLKFERQYWGVQPRRRHLHR